MNMVFFIGNYHILSKLRYYIRYEKKKIPRVN